METILDKWQITAEELTKIVHDNPSLRGFIFGYVSEYKARTYFEDHPGITHVKNMTIMTALAKEIFLFIIRAANLKSKQNHCKLILLSIKAKAFGQGNSNVMPAIEDQFFFQMVTP